MKRNKGKRKRPADHLAGQKQASKKTANVNGSVITEPHSEKGFRFDLKWVIENIIRIALIVSNYVHRSD